MPVQTAAPIAVIGFSMAASPLEPAWPSTHRALLPIAGKSLIVHLVEQLARSGIRHLRVAGSIQQHAVRSRLGDGSEWGVRVRYSDLHDGDLRLQTLLEHGECLYLCGDNLHIADFALLQPRRAVRLGDPALRTEMPAYWKMSPAGPAHYSIASATRKPYARVPLLTIRSYHGCSLSTARREEGSFVLPGRAVKAGVFIDWDSYVSPGVGLGRDITIGKHCRIGRRVRLDDRCVVGNGVVIGRDTRLRNVTVLPNTYIGADIRLQDAVITPLGIFSMEGTFLPSPDPAIFGRVRGNAERHTGLPSEKLSVLEKTLRLGRRAVAAKPGALIRRINDESGNRA